MKKITFISLLLAISFGVSAQTQKENNEEYLKIKALIENHKFEVIVDYVYPTVLPSHALFNNEGYIYVRDSVVESFLPFFGKAYSATYTMNGDGAIKFNDLVEYRKISEKTKKKRHTIIYKFRVKNPIDRYDVTIEVNENGSCSVFVSCDKRSSITYSGKVREAEKRE